MKMAIFFKLLFLPLIALSSENSERSEISPLSKSVREQIYEENGLDYAKQLYLENDGQIEDEVRTKKSDALNQKIRQKGIDKLEAKLSKNRDQRLRRELLLRLVQMYEQQAEITNRRSDLKNRELQQQQTIKKAIQHLLTLHKEFPQWHPDAILFGLAENYAKIKEQQAAEGFYRDIIRKYGNSPVVADSLLALGNLYFDRRLFETARGFYKKILDTEEINLHPYAHYKVAWCYFNEKDNSSAINGLEKAILESRKILQRYCLFVL